MNKNVFNYLNEKANDVADYIKAKAEAAGAYLSEHAQDIKQGAIKGTATVLTAAMLLGGMTGCDTLEQIGGPELEQYEQLPIRPIEEIEQSGITAEDVLALYDDLAEKCVEAHYATTNWKEELGERFNELDGQFISISPTTINEIGYENNYVLPFYLQASVFRPSNRWSTESSSPYYTNQKFINEEIYETVLTIKQNFGEKSGTKDYQWGVPKASFDKVLQAFNTPTITLDKEALEGKIPNVHFYQIEENYLWGTTAYNSVPLSREIIANATPEQLWALYDLINSMIELNFNATLPSLDAEHEIID